MTEVDIVQMIREYLDNDDLDILFKLRKEFERMAVFSNQFDSNSLSDFFGWINTYLNINA